jgi:hypothetical protein
LVRPHELLRPHRFFFGVLILMDLLRPQASSGEDCQVGG